MKCHWCGGVFEQALTDFPFKVTETSIVIVKGLPAWQCRNCREYMIEDQVMEKVDRILAKAAHGAELEVVRFAAWIETS